MKRAISLLIGSAAVSFVLCGCNPGTAQQKADETAKKSDVMEMKVTPVVQQVLSRDYELPGELVAYQDVAVHPKVEGFVQHMNVDRGSVVKRGQVLLTVSAPELDAKVREASAKVQSERSAFMQAQSKLSSARAAVKEGEAKLDADDATHTRLKKAAATPGVVADNDLEVSAKQVEGDHAHINALKDAVEAAKSMVAAQADTVKAAEQSLAAVKTMESYLVVTAPFDGVITSRNVHEGSLVDPKMDQPMVRIQEVSRLRLVVPLPEVATADVEVGRKVEFTVPAFPGKTFEGTIARVGHALDQHTRTMPVELDVSNADGRLAPGMYPSISWHVARPYPTLFVPATAVATTTERTFLIRVKDGNTEVVEVKRGQPMGNMVEVFGEVKAGDDVAVRASEDVKSGTKVSIQLASATDLLPKEKAAGGE
ncbi:MAG TPA: efflux RND transporter periplasmic adaptor subunit [Candidatus Obscuribacterales bacterium]